MVALVILRSCQPSRFPPQPCCACSGYARRHHGNDACAYPSGLPQTCPTDAAAASLPGLRRPPQAGKCWRSGFAELDAGLADYVPRLRFAARRCLGRSGPTRPKAFRRLREQSQAGEDVIEPARQGAPNARTIGVQRGAGTPAAFDRHHHPSLRHRRRRPRPERRDREDLGLPPLSRASLFSRPLRSSWTTRSMHSGASAACEFRSSGSTRYSRRTQSSVQPRSKNRLT